MRPVPGRVAARAYANVTVQQSGCWISNYSVGNHGYAQIGWADGAKNHMVLAHRASWVNINGQLPVGFTLDHVCKVRTCVNPEHLRLLSNFENARRTNGTDFPLGECAHGHPNSMLVKIRRSSKSGPTDGITCGECRRIRQIRYRANKKARLSNEL